MSQEIKYTHPYVVCVCPTYNRKDFLPNLIYMFNYQTYPKDRMHLIILDDSNEPNINLINEQKKKYNNENITYYYYPNKIHLGKKRNLLNELAVNMGADYISCFDDDDYYPDTKISYAIRLMITNKSLISGCSLIHVYYTNLKKIYSFGPYNNNHCTNGTMTYHIDFLSDKKYDDLSTQGEEKYFLNDYKYPILQLDPLKVILCISHNNNTVDKTNFISKGTYYEIKLKKIIKDKFLLNFYLSF